MYWGILSLSPPSFYCLNRYHSKFSYRQYPPNCENITRSRVDPDDSTLGTVPCLLIATDQHDVWPGSWYGNLQQEHLAPFVQTPQQPHPSLLWPNFNFHFPPPSQDITFNSPAFGKLDGNNNQLVRPQFSADNDTSYIPQDSSNL